MIMMMTKSNPTIYSIHRPPTVAWWPSGLADLAINRSWVRIPAGALPRPTLANNVYTHVPLSPP